MDIKKTQAEIQALVADTYNHELLLKIKDFLIQDTQNPDSPIEESVNATQEDSIDVEALNLGDKQLNDIAQEMQMGMDCYYHRNTGKFFILPNDEMRFAADVSPWEKEMEAVDNAPDEYIKLDKMGSTSSFSVMEDFAHSIPNQRFQNQALQTLSQPKPFRNFKDLVERSDYRADWFAYKTQRDMEYIKEQIMDELGPEE